MVGSRRILRATGATWQARLTGVSPTWSAAIAAAVLASLSLIVQSGHLFLSPGDWALGGPGDGWGGTLVVQEIVRSGLNPFKPGTINALNAPDGFPVPWQVNIQQWVTSLEMYGVTWITGDGEVAYNLYVLLGYALNAGTMAWLIVRLTGDRWVGILLGVLFSATPVVITNQGGHPAVGQIWPFVLMVIAYHAVHVNPTIKRGAIAGGVTFIAMSVSGYHLLFAAVEMVALIGGFALAGWRGPRRRALLKGLAASIAATVAGLVFVIFLILLIGRGEAPNSAVRDNPKFALYLYSSRPFEFVIPTRDSWLFGDRTAAWLQRHIHGSNPSETPLYLGVSVLFFAAIGVIVALRDRTLANRAGILVGGLLLAIVAFWVSLPPTIIPGLSIPTPSDLIFEFVTTWRVYSRLVVVVFVGVFILAAVGLSHLSHVRFLDTPARRGAFLCLAFVAIFADLRVRHTPVTEIDPPPISAQIRKLPSGPIAVYPLGRGENDGYGVFYNQQFWGDRPVLQGFDDYPSEARLGQLEDLSKSDTVMRLRALGARSAMVIQRAPTGLETFPVPAKPPKQMRFAGEGGYGPYKAKLYTISANHEGEVATFLTKNFSPVEGIPTDRSQWLRANPGTIELWGTCRTVCRGTLRFETLSLKPTYSATFSGLGKATVRRFGVRPITLSIPLTVRNGKNTLTVRTDPAPRPVSKLIVSADQRPVSMRVANLRWEPARR